MSGPQIRFGEDPVTVGQVVFADRHPSLLPPGRYDIETDQGITNTAPDPNRHGADVIDETYTNTRTFVVKGVRFTLGSDQIEALFPPANASGAFHNVLPHAVFAHRTLPWQRSPLLQARDPHPWLAILLFHDDERPPLTSSTLKDLQRVAGGTPGDVASYGDGYAAANATFGEFGEADSDPCLTIDVPAALFSAVAPTLADLQWLAHARQVSTAKKAAEKRAAAGTLASDFSVVVGSRLPKAGSACTAHLVSLEGLGSYLQADDAHDAPVITVAGGAMATAVRLVSLANWSFNSIDLKETFKEYLDGVSIDPPNLQLPSPPQQSGEAVAAALDLGYTAINHRTRTGADTVSWYRGPLVPYLTTNTVPAPAGLGPIEASDELLRYDPETGMFDVSYAAAWEIGRLLGLASASYASALYAWKRGAARAACGIALDGLLRVRLLGGREPSAPGVSAMADCAHAAAAWVAANLEPSLRLAARANQGASPGGAAWAGAAPVASPAVARAPRGSSRAARAHSLRSAAGDPGQLAQAASQAPVPVPVASLLQALGRLEGVPFAHLLADAALLPTESIRFFDLDLSWVTALLEGAFSVGRSSSADNALDAALAPALYAAAGLPARASGFLLRSGVVDGWPNLEVTPYGAGHAELTASPLRMERLAPSVLLYLYPDALSGVAIHEPAEGLHFGVDETSPQKVLRWLRTTPNGGPPGTPDPSITVTPLYRDDGCTLRVQQFSTDAQQTLKDKSAGAPSFTAAEFAIEMVATVDRVEFARQETTSSATTD